MRLKYNALLLAACFAGSTAASASESLVYSQTALPDDDHAYETVTHEDIDTKGVDFAEGWKIGGDIRTGLLKYDYSNPPTHIDLQSGSIVADPNINKGHADSQGFYLVPKLSVASPNLNGLEAKVTIAGATDFGLNDPIDEQRNFVFDPLKRSSFVILQEAYVSYRTSDGAHTFLAGAKETVTPMIDADDWYMLADSFQGAYYVNKSFKHLMFAGGYFYKMIGVWDSGANGTQWHTMSEASFVDSGYKRVGGDEGVWTGVVQYDDGRHKVQVWDYYMQDYYNTFFAQYDYKAEAEHYSYDVGAQIIDFQGVGGLESYYRDVLGGREIDYSIYSVRMNASHESGFDVALGASFYTDGDGTGDTLGAWGGYPYFANGMIFHFFEAGSLRNANTYKAQLGYNFKKQGFDGVWLGARYTRFDLDPAYAKASNGQAQDTMNLFGVRLSYSNENGIYFTGTYEKVDLDHEPATYALRLIGGYRF